MDKGCLLIAIAIISIMTIHCRQRTEHSQQQTQAIEYPALAQMAKGRNATARKELLHKMLQLNELEQQVVIESMPALIALSRLLTAEKAVVFGQLLQQHPELITRQLPKTIHAFVEYHNLSKAERRKAQEFVAISA